MKKTCRWASLILAATLIFSSAIISGCHHKETDETTEAAETSGTTKTSEVIEGDTEETSETTEWVDPDNIKLPKDYKNEALELAQKVGLTEDDLRGEYEYFIQFAQTVDGNPALYDYEGYVYQLFPMIADQIDEENKEYFLAQLENLVIEDGDAGPEASAYYAISNNYVLIGGWVFNTPDAAASLTVYHELIHFVDGAIGGTPANVAIMNDGSIVCSDELTEDQMADVTQYVEANFLVEGGAEHYVAKYFSNANGPSSYNAITAFSTALEYIIGTEKYDSMFFDSNTTYQFFELLEEYGFTDEEIVKVINGLQKLHYGYKVNFDSSDMISPQETLIRMYEEKFGTDFKDDLLFCELIVYAGNSEYFPYIAPYPPKFKDMRDEWRQIVAEEYGVELEDIGLMNYPTPVFIDGEIVFGSIYDVFYRNDFGRSEDGLFQFTYDFEKDEVIEYSTKVCDWVPGDVNEKLKNEKSDGAKELIESLKVDNSAAHDQKVTGSISELNDQYEKAAQIGSKHGIYFWFADLTPEGLLNENKTATDPDKIDVALDEISEVLDLYPEDYFDQLLFEYYKGFAICLYDGDYEPRMRGSYCVNGDYYMIININISNPSITGFYGADTVRNMGFTSVSIMKTQLVCEIWKCTEKFFANYNSHFEEPTKGDDSWKKVNQHDFTYTDTTNDEINELIMDDHYDRSYFLCKECFTFKSTDRCLLYEYVMLSVIADLPSDLTPECETKVDELCDEIRHYFDTSEWQGIPSWESI